MNFLRVALPGTRTAESCKRRLTLTKRAYPLTFCNDASEAPRSGFSFGGPLRSFRPFSVYRLEQTWIRRTALDVGLHTKAFSGRCTSCVSVSNRMQTYGLESQADMAVATAAYVWFAGGATLGSTHSSPRKSAPAAAASTWVGG